MRIIETPAKLIKNDIKTVKTSHCNYPGFDKLEFEEFPTCIFESNAYRFDCEKTSADKNCLKLNRQ